MTTICNSGDNWERDNFREGHQFKKKSKEPESKRRQGSFKGAIEKSQILLSQYWNNNHFYRAPKIISHFEGTNNIFVKYNYLEQVSVEKSSFVPRSFLALAKNMILLSLVCVAIKMIFCNFFKKMVVLFDLVV